MPRKIIYQEELTKEQKKAPDPERREVFRTLLTGGILVVLCLVIFFLVLRSCIDMTKTPGPAARPSVSSDPAVTRAVAGVLDEHFKGHYSIKEDGEIGRAHV